MKELTNVNVKELLEAKELLEEMKKNNKYVNTAYDCIIDLINSSTDAKVGDDINYFSYYYSNPVDLFVTTYNIQRAWENLEEYDIDDDEEPNAIYWGGSDTIKEFISYLSSVSELVDWKGEGFYIRNTGFVEEYMKAKYNKSETEQPLIKVDILEEIVDYLLDTIK